MNIDVKDNQEELERAKNALLAENAKLQKELSTVLSMLRFTLGIAYNAHPDNDKIKAMVDKLYVVETEGNGSR